MVFHKKLTLAEYRLQARDNKWLVTNSYIVIVGVGESRSDMNYSQQQQFFWELLSPGRSQYTNYWHSWVQTIYYVTGDC